MISKRNQFRSLLILLSIIVLANADFEDIHTHISSISTEPDVTGSSYRYSSLEGGAYLYIKGSGFSSRSASSNKVTVGDYDCPVIEYLTTNTQVVCQIPASPRAMSAPVRVYVDDVRLASGGSLTYSLTSTPQLIYLLPNAATPGDEIYYYGKQRVSTSENVDYIKFGEYRCDATEQNEFDSVTFSPNSNQRAPCSIPKMEAGYYNVTQRNLASTGFATIFNTIPTYRFDGNSYDFAVVPRIDSISNNKGSSEGQIITVTGSGFSINDDNEVYLGNLPCKILEQSTTQIQCELEPVVDPIPAQGYHAGLKFEAYRNKDIDTVRTGNPGTPSWSNANLVAEIKMNAANAYTSKMSGYFKAPVTGNYKFFVTADDKAQLYLSRTPLVKTGLELIVDTRGVGGYKFFYPKASWSQVSQEIALTEGEFYYMEAYHQEVSGDEYATFGVQIVGTSNAVNNLPEVQSLALSCEVQFEVLEFTVSNAASGVWRIRLDYLSSDGKKIERTATTANLTSSAAASSVSSAISNNLGLKNTVTKELLKSDGTVTTNSSEATANRYTVNLQAFRKNGKLPVIESSDLVADPGTSIQTKVIQTTVPSAPLSGSFTVQRGPNTASIAYNAATSTLEGKLKDIGFTDPIRVAQYGDADTGLEWRIQFTGDGAGPVEPLTVSTGSLAGCKDPETIRVQVNTIQESSSDLFYEVIPVHLLYTAEDIPQITVKSNGITGSCPYFNCQYEIQQDDLPQVTVSSYSKPALSLSFANIEEGKYTTKDIRVFLGNTECSGFNYDDTSSPVTLTVNCPAPEAGEFHPRVHFSDIGYAKVANDVQKISVDAVISNVAPTSINPNGGSTLTITGTGFPISLAVAKERALEVKVGDSTCTLETVSPTGITCTTTQTTTGSTLTVDYNEKIATSAETLIILTDVPSVSGVSPHSVNPVLQTNIIITGTNFDNGIANTKVLLANSTNSKVAECLPISSTSTRVECKLLGAPTGSYNIYVKTSKGYSSSQPFLVRTTLTSVTPSSGSNAGGTVITIQGGIFSDDVQQTLVFIGEDNVLCDVITSTASQVTCRTQAKSEDTASGVANEVVVTTRLVEDSFCEEGNQNCRFTFSDALTPKISSVNVGSAAPGTSIEITGTGFDSTPAGTAPVVTIDGTTCNIVSSSGSQIVFTVPENLIPNVNATLNVNVAGKGNADFGVVNKTVQVTPRLDSISPATGSKYGVLVTFTGAGFQPGIAPKIGSGACIIRSLTSTSIVCKATSQGVASITYGDFAGLRCSGACNLAFADSSSPTLTSVTPSPTGPTFSLTINGNRLNLGTNTVRLISNTDSTVYFDGAVNSNSASSISVDFQNVAAGSYSVEVASGANIASSTVTVSVPLSASTVSAVESSIAGGVTLSVSGSGFFPNDQKDKNKVTVCGLPCTVTQSALDSIQCQTPLFVNAAVKTTYENLTSASKLTPASTWSDAKQEGNLFDVAFTTAYKSSLTNCEIGIDIGAGLLGELSQIKYFPNPNITSSTLKDTIIEGSNDNTTYTVVATIDANAHDGWNTINFEDAATPIRYRYYRLSGANSTAKCALSELQFFGIPISSNSAASLNAIDCSATVTVNDISQDAGLAVHYRQTNTAVLRSISPEMGTTAGGTTLTLTGTGFDTTVSNVKVTIDDVECEVQSATATEIKCLTGAAPSISNRRSSLQSELKIHFANKGNAITNNLKYFYVDKWSDLSTWGGITPPREGDSVSIPPGQTILLDISPPKLKAIIIEGALIFDDANIDLHAEYIFVRNGRFQIGTWDNPIQNKITVTLYGNKQSPHLPTFGNKVLAVMEGILDIHGKKRSHTWTVLDTTAQAKDTSIVIRGNVDWQVGEEIVIASTDHDHYQSESRVITRVDQNTPSSGLTKLHFAEPLKNKHYAALQTIEGIEFDMRAEVGLLTRNVVIQGDESSQKLQYGAHIMMHSSTGDDSSVGRISYTEIRQSGQAFNLGRYSIHFHLIGNTRESYVIGNAVHHSYNRAVTIHGVHYLKVQKNVAYWCMGHTIFIEDGIETHNVIEDNLVVNTIASPALLNTDQTPASFWITNPNNIWRGNHAAGSDRYGFWFDLREHPEGPSATTSICPTGEKLGEFTDNQAHSSGRYGLRIFHELIPRTYPCEPYSDFENNPPIPAEFKNFFGWKNRRDAIIGERLGAVTFKNIKAADNHRSGIEISDGNWSPRYTLRVEDAWIVGVTPDSAADTSVYEEKKVRGLMTPKKDFFFAKNVHFYNFGNNMTAIETCSHCEHGAATDQGARTAYLEGLTFSNVNQRVRFNTPQREILYDNDGSLTGNTGGGVVTYFYDHLNVPGCTRDEDVYNGLVCNNTVTIRKVEFIGLAAAENFQMHDLKIFRVEDNPDEVYGSIEYREKPRKSWSIGFVTGYTYKLNWASRADFASMQLLPSEVIQTGDKPFTLAFNHSEYRETFDIASRSNSNITNTTTLWQNTNTSLVNGEWYHDVDEQFLYVAVTPNGRQDLTLKSVKCRVNCPVPASKVPKDGIIRLWSNATQWPGGVVPRDGDNVEIPGNWTIKLDVNTAKLKKLHVMGDLFFDSTKDNLVLTAELIWVEGQVFIGNDTYNRFTKNAKIVLTGLRNTEGLILGAVQDVSNKVLAVTGNLTIYGKEVKNVYTRLQAPARIGDTTIRVPTDIDWSVGDEIMIAPTQRNNDHYETCKIAAINNGVITLEQPIQYFHFGAATTTKTTPYGTLDARAEVGLLTRNIIVEGTDEDTWGGRIYIGEIYDPEFDIYVRGRADIDGLEMRNLGQSNNFLAGLTFERLVADTNDASSVTRSVMRDTEGYQLRIIGSDGVSIENNIFYRSKKFQVRLEDQSNNLIFKNNLVVANRDRGLVSDHAKDMIVSLYSDAVHTNSEISNNIIAGCFDNCVIVRGEDCSTETGTYKFRNNVAHSGKTGWVFSEPNEICNSASHFVAYKLDLGIVSYFKNKQIKASNLFISDSTIGMALNTGVFNDAVITLTNSYIAGITLTGAAETFANTSECSNLKGIYIPQSTDSAKAIPPTPTMLPWEQTSKNHMFGATFTVSDVTIENFKDNIVPGCANNFVFSSNPSASDSSPTTQVSRITANNIGPNNRVYFHEGNPGWVSLEDCGGWLCTGIRNIMIRDLDGSLTGAPTSLMPGNPATLIDTCTYSVNENANVCVDQQWGILTFQSLDVDLFTRILSPIYVNTLGTSGFNNKLNTYMDHVWDGFYTGLKRLSRFHSVIQSNDNVKVEFTGTLPNGLRWQYQGGLIGEGATVEYGYTEPLSVKVTDQAGNVYKPLVVKTAAERAIKATDPCGTNLYNVDTRKITLRLTADANCRLDVHLTNSVRVTVRYEIPIDEFFSQNGAAAFVDKVAAILRINPASVRVVEVRSGSSVVYAYVDSTHQGETAESDAAARAELNQMIATLQAAQTSGELRILNSTILNSSFEMSLIRTATTDSTTGSPEVITSGDTLVIVIIAVVVGIVALAVGSYFAYQRYNKRKEKVYPIDASPTKIESKIPGSPSMSACVTENPLFGSSSRVLMDVSARSPDVSSRSPGISNRSPIDIQSP